jgi:hypothetical protein
VNPNHGLHAFFRKREKDGKVTHDPFEDDSGLQDVFGELDKDNNQHAFFV